MALFVGLDVSLKLASICVVEADGTSVWEGKAESEPTPLIKTLMREDSRPIGTVANAAATFRNGAA